MAQPKPLVAFYDLKRAPPTFNILHFLAMAKTIAKDRPLHVVIVPRDDGWYSKPAKFSYEQGYFRFLHILLECIPLFGATYSVCVTREHAKTYTVGEIFPRGYSVDKPEYDYDFQGVLRTFREHGNLAAPQPSKMALGLTGNFLHGLKRPLICVTLRHSRQPQRNSDESVWFEWARTTRFGVVLVPDTESAFDRNFAKCEFPVFLQASVSVDYRLAAYELSDACLFTSNGPGALVWNTDKPYLFFKAGGDQLFVDRESAVKKWAEWGIPWETQPPFIRKRQKWIWGAETADGIRKNLAEIGFAE